MPLTVKELRAALEARAKSEGKELTLGLTLDYAREYKGALFYIVACFCAAICFGIGMTIKIFKIIWRQLG